MHPAAFSGTLDKEKTSPEGDREKMQKIPRIVVGAVQGRSGKTTFTLGLLKALKTKGYQVQPFKKGPDYIDPSWMTFASGVPCRNLDAFMMRPEQIMHTFVKHSQGMDISVVEGAMGLFDGLDVEGSNSTAQLAYLIQSPVILVVNCQRITRSVAAIINGVVGFDPRITIGGVILNNVARPRHQNIMLESIKKYCQVPVLGMLPKSKDIEIPDRHLGLIPAGEQDMLLERVENLGRLVLDNVDLDALLKVAHKAPELAEVVDKPVEISAADKVRIGVIRDRAFSFYYPENLEALEEAGAELVYIDSIKDQILPEIDGLYIGGGFPEVMAAEISANIGLRQAVQEKIEQNLPVYAECGGLMYLSKSIIIEEERYPMVGVLPCSVRMEKKPQGHGYAIQRCLADNPFFEEGTILHGHEFHNSRIIDLDEGQAVFGFETQRGKGIIEGRDGLVYKNTFAAYNHLHAAADENWAASVVRKARTYKNSSNICNH